MTSFKINSFQEIEKNKLLSGVYIWVIHADKIPPHIGISSNGKFYSLKVNVKDNGSAIEPLFKILAKKNIQTLFIEVNNKNFKELNNIFDNYESLNTRDITCLTPILDFLDEDLKIETVSELLVILAKKNQINSFFGLNLPPSFNGISIYSKIDIQERILKLQNVKRSNNFSESN